MENRLNWQGRGLFTIPKSCVVAALCSFLWNTKITQNRACWLNFD